MRVLFSVVNTLPLWTARGGGGPVLAQHLDALVGSGHEVHLLVVVYADRREEIKAGRGMIDAEWGGIVDQVASLTEEVVAPVGRRRDRVGYRLNRRARNGGPTALSVTLERSVLRPLRHRVMPDVVWAEHLAAAEIALVRRRVPVVYGHHDWIHALRANLDDQHRCRLQVREQRVAREADVVVSGSQVEVESLAAIGARSVYLPHSVPESSSAAKPRESPHLVHLGGMTTTASREGLRRFMMHVWPKLPTELRGRFDVIGDLKGADDDLLADLEPVRTLGFVYDLSSVLRPFDIHVIPWDRPTGTRTRVAVALENRQVLVAVAAGVAGYPMLRDGENCVLVRSLDEMASVLTELSSDPARRERLGHAGQQTIRAEASTATVRVRTDEALQAATAAHQDRRRRRRRGGGL